MFEWCLHGQRLLYHPLSFRLQSFPTAAVETGVTVVVVVDVSVDVDVVAVSSSDPQAANDKAIKETPPAFAAFAFFFS